jgi:hypothetical protein
MYCFQSSASTVCITILFFGFLSSVKVEQLLSAERKLKRQNGEPYLDRYGSPIDSGGMLQP